MTVMTNKEAFEAMLAHHASLVAGVNARATSLSEVVASGALAEVPLADLVAYLAAEVLPHADAEEASIYRAASARPELAATVAEMTNEHRVLAGTIERLARSEPGEAVEAATTIATRFGAHVQKENDLLLPALLAAPDGDLAGLLGTMHDHLVGAEPGAPEEHAEPLVTPTEEGESGLLSLFLEATDTLARAGDSEAACRLAARAWAALRVQRPDLASRVTIALHDLVRLATAAPVRLVSRAHDGDTELDVRPLSPARRHEAIFARYGALEPGTAFILVNDHDPKPLRYQFEAEHAGLFSWDYLEDGPNMWRVRIGKTVPAA